MLCCTVGAKRKATASGTKSAPAKKIKSAARGTFIFPHYFLDDKSNSIDVGDDDKPLTAKIIIKGKVPVDPQCAAKVSIAHVLHEGDEVYNFMLNQVSFTRLRWKSMLPD